MQQRPIGRASSECTFDLLHWGFAGSTQGCTSLTLKDDFYQMKERMDVSTNNSVNAVQGVLQSLTSTVGSAANTVTSTAKSAVNRLTGEGSNGLTPSYGPTVRHNLQQALQSNAHVLCFLCVA